VGKTYSTIGENRNILLVGKPEGKITLRKQRRSWVDNIKMGLGDIGWGSVAWTDLEGSCECGNEPSGSIKYCEVLEWLHNWRPLE
jgi:hypothetical protein